MTDVFSAVSAFTRTEEGGYSNDARDAGNWSTGLAGHGALIGSNYGVGAPAAIAWMHPQEAMVTPAWMRAIPLSVYTAMAKAKYWRPLQCDLVPPALAMMLFDYGWNRGIANGARELQETIGVTRDGDIGPQTLAAVAGVNDLVDLLRRFAAVQTAHYRALHNFSIYGRGWLARTDRRLAAALAMTGPPPGTITPSSGS